MTENFLSLTTKEDYKIMVAKSSIAVLVDHSPNGCVLTLKDTYPDGKRIAYNILTPYMTIIDEIKKYENVK